jgi:hypothetical protein
MLVQNIVVLTWITTLAVWCHVSLRTVTDHLRVAGELRTRILADPLAAQVEYCSGLSISEKGCQLSFRRRTTDLRWVDVCTSPLARAKRWYEVRLTCRPYGSTLGPLTVTTTIWR